MHNVRRLLFLTGLASAVLSAQELTPVPDQPSLVPATPSTAPDYYCTWNLQGYVTGHVGGRGSNDVRIEMHEDNLFGGEYDYKAWGVALTKSAMNNAEPAELVTWTVLPRYQGWLNHFPQIRQDLIFVIDDSWDIPKGPGGLGASKRPHGRNYDNEYLALLTINQERFPSFQGSDLQRMTDLTAAVRGKGWRGLGGWICAQDPICLTKEYTGMENTRENSLRWTEEQEEQFWKKRLQESEQAGFCYWKVDWGNKDRDETFRRNLSKWGREVAPHVIIEHASFQNSGAPTSGFLAFSQTLRTYDVNNDIAQAQTIRRVKDLGDLGDVEIPGWGIINCEDEPYIAAGLGCAIGVMRHPYVGDMPNGKPDYVFVDYGEGSRRLKNRLNEIVRAIRWHRIAQPFGHESGQWASDDVLLEESGDGRREAAPARVSRRMPLPEFVGGEQNDPLRPYLLASIYDNDCAALAIINRNINGVYQQQRTKVRFQPLRWDRKVAVFGYCKQVTLAYQGGLPGKPFIVLAQDLAADEPMSIPYAITPDGKGIVIEGKYLEACCKGHDYPYSEVEKEPGRDYTDISDPAVVILIKEK